MDGRKAADFERIGHVGDRVVPTVRDTRGPVRGREDLQRELVSRPACDCGACVRANHGQPAVIFEDTRYRRGYELHGTQARDWYAARDKARAELEALKVKLRG